MLKPEDNPPILYPDESTLEDQNGPWWVAHTRSRHEKALAHFLLRSDIAYFLPLHEKVQRRQGRRIKSLLPLFSGYLFFAGDEQKRHKAFTSNKIANVLPVVNVMPFLGSLRDIYCALECGLPVSAHAALAKGTRCRVQAGPLKDKEGFVIEHKGKYRILLQVDILGQAAAVEIDQDDLEIIDG